MTHIEIKKLSERIRETDDAETDHAEADEVLIECIRLLANKIDNTEPISRMYEEATEGLIKKFRELYKWYA